MKTELVYPEYRPLPVWYGGQAPLSPKAFGILGMSLYLDGTFRLTLAWLKFFNHFFKHSWKQKF
jgi:hypothetical protein